ncbi:hypothetical protein QWZ17_25840 [Mucilaginibacter flavus]|nr:hypothetical protein [Mucilaginibacter flavus]
MKAFIRIYLFDTKNEDASYANELLKTQDLFWLKPSYLLLLFRPINGTAMSF